VSPERPADDFAGLSEAARAFEQYGRDETAVRHALVVWGSRRAPAHGDTPAPSSADRTVLQHPCCVGATRSITRYSTLRLLRFSLIMGMSCEHTGLVVKIYGGCLTVLIPGWEVGGCDG
jgi:hypothetical protein